MEFPDLTALSLQSTVALLLLIGVVDTAGSMLIALASGTFSAVYATGYLVSHVAKMWFPIFALALVGNGIAPFAIPAIPAASWAASLSLAAYGVATLGSLKASLADRSIVPESEPI